MNHVKKSFQMILVVICDLLITAPTNQEVGTPARLSNADN